MDRKTAIRPSSRSRNRSGGAESARHFGHFPSTPENRWTKDSVEIDQRTDRLCEAIKADKIKLYTIRVIEGNETILRNCASKPSMYFSVNQATELKGVFDKIAAELTTLRLSF